MADWNKPTITSQYIDFVAEMNGKFVDAATLQFGNPINFPLQTIRFNRSLNLFQEWLGPASGWQNKVLAVAGGGTGAASAADTRTNLGLGSMSTQNSNAVNITGGSITGITVDVSTATGILPLGRGGTGSALGPSGQGAVLGWYDGIVQFIHGSNIPNLNASYLQYGTVPLARLSGVALLDSNNIFSLTNQFNGHFVLNIPSTTGYFNYSSDVPSMVFRSTNAASGRKNLVIYPFNGDFSFRSLSDDFSTAITLFTITSGGALIGYGGSLTDINASALTFGTVAPARLGSGSANSGTFLRGDGTWAPVSTGGEVSPIPSGLIAIFDTACPSGWTRFTQLDNKFPLGSGSAGSTGGSDTHRHHYSANTNGAGSHSHAFNGSGSGKTAFDFYCDTTDAKQVSYQGAGPNVAYVNWDPAHNHRIRQSNIPVDVQSVSGSTDGVGNHSHFTDDFTDSTVVTPPYYTVVYCRKN